MRVEAQRLRQFALITDPPQPYEPRNETVWHKLGPEQSQGRRDPHCRGSPFRSCLPRIRHSVPTVRQSTVSLACDPVDTQRWLGFDLFCAWQDVYLMSLRFFLSGCFVWTSLERKGRWRFLRERLVRIGIPLAIAVAFLMPVALFPVYLRTAADPTLTGYWHAWRNLPFWPCGPQWFLGVLLMLNIVAAANPSS
jgi:Acyltransferase family